MIMLFPWPPAALSPNSRLHWRKKHKAKIAYQAECHYGRAKFFNNIEGQTRFRFTFHPADRRRRDVDNVIAQLKCLVDLLALHSGIDDSKFDIEWPRVFSDVREDGRVQVEVLSGQERMRRAA